MRATTWNLFHGRDKPPDATIRRSPRSKYLRTTESNATHVQVNRSLRDEFAETLAEREWDIVLLQEAPPRWLRPLCLACKASGASALTSRNFGAALRAAIADWNPDIIASNEGGSNQLLVRAPWRIADVRRLTLTFLPERRRMIWTRLEHPEAGSLAVSNLHATAHVVEHAARDVELAAERALTWAAGAPLIFGGDFNLRTGSEPWAFEMLRERYGLNGPTEGPQVLDHLLVRGLDVVEPPRQQPVSARERPAEGGRALRLSDHEIVTATLGVK